ncbi:MAG: hypothetical protein CFE30_10850 [Bradyrhizobium sp. PARBB1]|nr:MAG: hypothetical protein CFE30_10850 [Bradyrhizobium sp. PARBB1]PSO24580.1 hypothetical protein C7G43_18960 [Bradyrhizobium sp. MOS004]HAQ81744.1 hypothetical protein [Bradyrhizobium sp.]HAR15095.1 hypothetical protein [Bradyrhizobium sp.]HAR25821.1 hypothetical protein [Bradyrhizobium sp.]
MSVAAMSAVMTATVMTAMRAVSVAMVEVRTMMPSVMARSVAVTRLPIAAAPAIADLAHLVDIGRFACDVAGLRKPVRQRRRRTGHQRRAPERDQSNNGKLDIHRNLLG